MSLRFIQDPPRFLFFTGKGGVGKTSIACATAVALAESGRRVLLVSTDPASNVGQVFATRVGNEITAIDAVPGLSALEIDPEAAAESYRERIIGPVRGILPAIELAGIVESLSGSCTTEVASFDEFTGLLTDAAYADYDHIVFDTAPTGHTIRLLQLPGSWTEYLATGGDASCLGPMSGLEKHRATYAAAVEALADPARTRLVLVARAQASSLAELDRTYAELAAIGMTDAFVVVNGMLPATGGDDPLAGAIRERESAALAAMPSRIAVLPRDLIDLKVHNILGAEALRSLFHGPAEQVGETVADALIPDAGLASLIDAIEADGHGLVLFMGKGGVGKTTLAAATAAALAERGHDVLLTTTDPAAHLTETLAGTIDHLTVNRIDPAEAVGRYRARVMDTKGRNLDDADRRALAEDLMSPCTEEVAVFQQFSHAVYASRRQFVVIDTAPTGHTLLLLDATGSYHRDIARQMGETGMPFTTPLMRLQDPAQTKVVLVTLPETTPVLEASGLQDDLERAGIHPWAWVVNDSIAAAHPTDPFLRARAHNEVDEIAQVAKLTGRIAIVPLQTSDPIGADRLRELIGIVQPA